MRRRISLLAALTATLSVGALALAGPATAVPRDFFGIAGGGFHSSSDVERMGKGNVGSLRFLISWPSVETADDQFDFSAVDRFMGDLAAAGIQPFPFVFGTPGYVNSDSLEMPVGSTADEGEWREFMRTLVARYGQGGTYWTTVFPTQHPGDQPMPPDAYQIWNEENAVKHVDKPDPAGYARLLAISRNAIASEDPGAEIVLGGMFGTPRRQGGLKATSFLKRMYNSPGVKESFDGVALHPYSPDVAGIKKQIEKVRKVLKKKKDKGAEVWVTELGWGSKKKGRLGVGKKKQAKLLKGSFKLLKKKSGKWNIGGVMWYTWRDSSAQSAACDWCRTAGLMKANGTKPKPSFKAFVKFTGGS